MDRSNVVDTAQSPLQDARWSAQESARRAAPSSARRPVRGIAAALAALLALGAAPAANAQAAPEAPPRQERSALLVAGLVGSMTLGGAALALSATTAFQAVNAGPPSGAAFALSTGIGAAAMVVGAIDFALALRKDARHSVATGLTTLVAGALCLAIGLASGSGGQIQQAPPGLPVAFFGKTAAFLAPPLRF